MNLMTINSKIGKSKKYNVSVDLAALERIAGSLGLFQPKFIKDMSESLRDMKLKRLVRADSLKRFR